MIDSDLKRSYYQYLKHIKMGHINTSYLDRVLLSFIFVGMLIISFIFALFFFKKNNVNKQNYLIDHSSLEPHKSIKAELTKNGTCHLIKFSKYALPILPLYFYIEIFKKPIFYLKRMDFLGALSLKVSQYYFLYYKNNMNTLIVLQEYSFYMSYLTFLIEKNGGKLFNVMHGIPGEESSFFRFSKCFVWGKYFKEYFIKNGASRSQFMISGSIYHTNLRNKVDMSTKKIFDIVYFMQGEKYVLKDEIIDTLTLLTNLSNDYNVAVKQHPLYPAQIDQKIYEISNDDIAQILNQSKIVISHFSTSLLDARVLNTNAIAYSKINRSQAISFVLVKNVVNNPTDLLKCIKAILDSQESVPTLSKDYIDFDKDTLTIIKEALT